MRILLVDDDAPTVRAMRVLLGSRGHQVSTCGTLADARRQCQPGAFDLMLCDLGLPDGDGCELADVARGSGVRAIAVTGSNRDALGGAADGFWGYLTKPVSFERLNAIVLAASTVPAC